MLIFLIIPNAWLFNKSVHLWAKEWYWHRNDHIFVFLSKLTMLYLGPKVSVLFSCMWCKSGNWYVSPKETLVIPHLVFILNCLTFTLKHQNRSIWVNQWCNWLCTYLRNPNQRVKNEFTWLRLGAIFINIFINNIRFYSNWNLEHP